MARGWSDKAREASAESRKRNAGKSTSTTNKWTRPRQAAERGAGLGKVGGARKVKGRWVPE